MSDASSIESRFKRPELERSEPRRHFSGMFGAPGPAAPAPEGVARGVDLGYRVIEDYLRQGQNFARTMFDRGSPEPETGANDPQRLAERMLHYASDLAAAWFEYVRVIGIAPRSAESAHVARGRSDPFDIEPHAGPAPGPGHAAVGSQSDPFDMAPRSGPTVGHERAASNGEAGAFDRAALQPVPAPERAGAAGAPAVETASATRIALALASKQPAEVLVDLKPHSAGLALSAHDLRARDPDLPRISGVLIESDAGTDLVKIQIQIPDDQPAATYHGIIIDDATNLPRGTLSLRIRP